MLDTTYLIVPNIVAQDTRLNNFDKLLFGKIYSLTKQQGYCWATNEYLSIYFKESLSYISKSIKRIEQCGYITREIDNKKDNNHRRKIYVNYNYLYELESKNNNNSLVL